MTSSDRKDQHRAGSRLGEDPREAEERVGRGDQQLADGEKQRGAGEKRRADGEQQRAEPGVTCRDVEVSVEILSKP